MYQAPPARASGRTARGSAPTLVAPPNRTARPYHADTPPPIRCSPRRMPDTSRAPRPIRPSRNAAHVRPDLRVGLVRHDVQDTFRIVRKNQLVRLDGALQEAVVGRPERGGDPDRLRAGAPDPVKDHVLLQHAVLGKGGVPGVVDVDPAKGQLLREGLPEGPETGPVHEAARCDRHELAAAGKELEREPDEGRVEVAGFDPRGAQARALRAVAPELAVRGVHDRHVESRMAFGFEEILVVGPGGCVEDEVPPAVLAAEGDPGLRAYRTAVLEGAVQIVGEPGVELPDGGMQGGGSAALGPAAKLGHRRGRQDAAAATGVEDPEIRGRLAHLEHGGHETGDADRSEELPQLRTAAGIGRRPFREVGSIEIEALQEVRCGDGRAAVAARSWRVACVHHRPHRILDAFTHLRWYCVPTIQRHRVRWSDAGSFKPSRPSSGILPTPGAGGAGPALSGIRSIMFPSCGIIVYSQVAEAAPPSPGPATRRAPVAAPPRPPC